MKDNKKNVAASPPSDEEDDDAKRARIRHALDTLPGVIKETCKVYREMRADQLDHMKGRSLVWVLSMLRAALETQARERLEEIAPTIEGRNHGHQSANRLTRTAH